MARRAVVPGLVTGSISVAARARLGRGSAIGDWLAGRRAAAACGCGTAERGLSG